MYENKYMKYLEGYITIPDRALSGAVPGLHKVGDGRFD